MKQQRSERGAALKSLRREAGLSQFKVAVGTGVDPVTISRLERGTVKTITRKSAEALAKFFSAHLGRQIEPTDIGYHVGRNKKEQSIGDEHER